VRRYDPKDGSTKTILGSGARGGKLVANDPLATELNRPHGVAYAPDGALFISDSENNRVLRLK
jgi:glucose/arabinose dehydrogenase